MVVVVCVGLGTSRDGRTLNLRCGSHLDHVGRGHVHTQVPGYNRRLPNFGNVPNVALDRTAMLVMASMAASRRWADMKRGQGVSETASHIHRRSKVNSVGSW